VKRLVKAFAHAFRQIEIQPGARVLVMSPENIHAPIIWLGTIAAGAIFAGRAPYFTAEQQAFYGQHSEAKALLVHESLDETWCRNVWIEGCKGLSLREDLEHGSMTPKS
ncbi:MAG: hypothetical protein Q9175_008307, partial [Cornicularia normoerica]